MEVQSNKKGVSQVILHDTPHASLGVKVLQGSALQFSGRFLFRGLKFIRTIIIAQLLFPEDVGLFALASLCLGFADVFIQTGFQSAIIESKTIDKRHLDGVWTVHVGKGILLATVAFLIAPILATFFDEPRLTEVLRVLSVILALDGFVNVGVILLHRELQFGKKLLFDFSYIATEIVAVIIAAYFLQSVWALVIGAIASQVASTLFSYVFHGYRPRFTLDFTGAGELFRYGKWVSMIGIITFFVSKGDGIAISKLIGVEELAYYQFALSLALLPCLEIVRTLGTVFFPYFARIKERPDELRESFVRTTRMMLLIALPAMVGLYVAAYPIVSMLYGERWLPIIPVLHILVFYGACKSVEYLLTPILLGTGKPKLVTYATILYGVVLGSAIIPLTVRHGVEGTAWSMVLAAGISSLYLCMQFYKAIPIRLEKVVSMVWIPIVSSALMYILVMLQERFVLDSIIASLVTGAVVYTSSVYIFDRYSGRNLMASLSWIRNNLLAKRTKNV